MKYLFLKGQRKPEYGIFIPRSDIEVMCIFGQKFKKKKVGYSEQTGCTFIVVSSHVAGVRACVRGSLLKWVSSLNSQLVAFPQS